jgi:hypothetical protein
MGSLSGETPNPAQQELDCRDFDRQLVIRGLIAPASHGNMGPSWLSDSPLTSGAIRLNFWKSPIIGHLSCAFGKTR